MGQASANNKSVHKSYLAASADKIEEFEQTLESEDYGSIAVGKGGEIEWSDPSRDDVPGALPDIKSQLRYQLRNQDSIGKIASLNLSHPINFLAPCIIANQYNWDKLSQQEMKNQLEKKYSLSNESLKHVITGASVLGLIELNGGVDLTASGELGCAVLEQHRINSLSDLHRLKEKSERNDTIRKVEPLIALWLTDQFRKHPEFNILYNTIQDRPSEKPVLITEIARELIYEYPNTFLNLFCTSKPTSIEKVRQLLESNDQDKIVDDLDVFREVLNQNIIQNFTRQLKHIGVLSTKTSSTNVPKEEYDPESYPWYPASQIRTKRFKN
jgi:hypothetical protein